MSLKNKTVAYFYDEEIGNFSYGSTNPMRPHRVRLTHSLVDSYGLGSKMLVNRPQPTTADELERFHADGEFHLHTAMPFPQLPAVSATVFDLQSMSTF